MEKVQGKIESVETSSGEREDGSKWKRASLKLGGKSYSTFDDKIISENESGDSVEIEYDLSKDGKFKNIKTIKKIEFKPASEVPQKEESNGSSVWLEKDRRISRMATINASIEMMKALNEIEPEKVKNLLKENKIIDLIMNSAEVLESFVWRQ